MMRCWWCVAVSCLVASGWCESLPETFFGVDAAASWLTRPGLFTIPSGETDLTAYVVEKIDKTGFRQVRERLSWGEVNPRPDGWDFSYYQKVYDLYRARGIRVSGMFHDAPPWMEKRGRIPTDLKCVYEFCRKVAETMGDRVDDWEFWNEEDIGFCPAAAWDYAAAAKAAYLGFKDASASHPALMGALCKDSRTAYDDMLFANDLGLYTDVMNFHTYAPIASYPRVFGDLRKFMEDHGIGERAIWVTESGSHEEGQATDPGLKPGLFAHTSSQEEVHAEIAARSQFALMMEGVSRDYFFCFPPYNEQGGRKDWGVMRRDGTLKPVADVFKEMIARLGTATMIGETKDGFVFRQKDGSFTLCSVGKGRPTYRDGVKDFKILRSALKPGRVGVTPAAADEDRRIVLQLKTEDDAFVLGSGKSALEISGDSGEMTVVVYNFDGREKSGLMAAKDGLIEGLPAQVTVPAWGKVEIRCRYRAKSDVPTERIVLRGRFAGRKTSRLVTVIKNQAAILGNCVAVPLAIEEDARWKRNDSADEFESTWDAGERARKFHLVWTRENDRWTYPKYSVCPSELSGAVMLEYEIKSAQDKVENDFNSSNVMLFESNRMRRIGVQAPLGAWEKRRVDFFAEKNLEAVKFLSIGLNPCGHDLTYWIRNVRLYKAEIPQAELRKVYDAVKTPFKYGVILEPDDGFMFDNPNVFRHGDAWYMLYVVFDKNGYETHLAKSADLLRWKKLGKVLPYGETGAWDCAQSDGGPSLLDPDWEGSNELRSFDGRYWMTYIGGAKMGYETDPLAIGVASTDDPTVVRPWTRLVSPVLTPSDRDARPFEKKTLFKSFVLDDPCRKTGHRFVMYYNAKQKGEWVERIGMAVSDDMQKWTRFGTDACLRQDGALDHGITGDPMVRKIGNLYVMFYFGYNWEKNGCPAFDTFAVSKDLVNWTKWQGPPLVASSESWDQKHAHKPWVIKHNGIVYHFYCAVGDRGRVLALATSRPLGTRGAGSK